MKKSISTFFLTLALVLMSVVGANAQVAWSEDFGSSCTTSGNVSTLTALGWDTLGYQAGSYSSTTNTYHWRTYTGGVEGCCARLYAYYYYVAEESLLSPSVAMPSTDDYMLSFKLKNTSAGGDLDVFVVAGGTTTYLEQHIQGVTDWTVKEYSLANYRGQSIRIGFRARSGASTTYYYNIDDVEVKKAPTCQKIVNLAAGGLSTTSVNLTWTYKGTGFGDVPSKCYVTVTDAGGNVVKTDSTSTGAYSISLTGLQPNTTYTATVIGDCRYNYGGYSDPTSVTFTTMMPAVNPPYEETFESVTTLPAGSNYTGNVSLNTTASYAYGAAGKSLKMTVTASANAMFVTPLINLSADNTEVEFQLKSANSGTSIKFSAGYMTDISDIGTYVPMINDSIYQTTDWKEVRFNTSENVGIDNTNPIMIAIQIQGGASASVYVDNLQAHVIPTCIRPEAVTVSNVTANTAEVAWTTSNANNHIIRLQNLSDSTWLTFNAGVSPYTITGLTQNTPYGNLTVQGVCSAADSSTVKRTLISFKTLCDVSPTAIFFEGAEGTTNSALPDCWLTGLIQQGTGTSGYSYDVPFYTHGTSSNACAGVRGFQLRDQKAGTISYLSSQAMNFEQVGKYSFRYSIYRPSGTGSNGEGLKVYVTPTPGDTTNGVLVIPFVNRMAGNSPVGTTGCNTYEGIINYGGTGHITIVGVSQFGSSTYFDNLEVFLTPSCPKPGSISTSNVTSSSIDLSWNAGNTETEWLLSYSVTQAGQVVDAATVTVSNQPTYTINNLSPATSYSVTATLRALCGVGDTSEVVTMPAASFTTACTTISIFPYRENFESMTANAAVPCWSTAASTSSTTGYNLWGVYSYSSNKSIRCNIYSVQRGDAVIDMPQMTLPNVPMKWTFDYSHRANCDSLYARISTDGVNFTNLASFGATGTSTTYTDPGTFTNASIDLSAYQGQTVTLRYFVVSNYGNGAIYVDNIVVRALPSCPDVDANPTQVDGTTATLTLDTTMTTWQISLGNTPGDSIIDVTGASTYTLTGLTPTTLYRYYVRSVCDTNYGDWSQSHSFTTTKLCPDLTATISDVTATSALVTKDASISGNWQIAVDADTIIDVAGATYTLTGLTPGTTYTVRVRKDCGSGMYGDWSADYTVVTPALPATLPYVCGFEDVQENNRWTFVDGAGVNVFTIGTDANAIYDGAQALYVTNSRTSGTYGYTNSSSCKSFAYRDIHFDSKGYQVNFKVKATGGESTWDFGRVFLTNATEVLPAGSTGSSYSGTTFPATVAEFDEEFVYSNYKMFNCSTCVSSVRDAQGWVTVSYFLDMTTRAAGDYKLVIMWSDDSSGGSNPPIAIDNINIYELTCIPPSTVLTNNITSTSADLEIQQQDASEWEVLVSTSSINIENLPDSPYYRQITTSDIVSLTDLTPNTDYYYTVRAICGANDTSDWRTPDMLHTQCAAVNIPLMEGFDNANSTKCWTNIGDGTISHSTSYKKTGTGSMQIAATTGISPEFITDSLTNFMINGWARSTVDSATFSVGIMNDPNDATSFEPLTDVTIPTSGTWFEFTSYFTALNDDDYEDWRYAKYVGIATGTYTICFDDIIIDLTPTCPKPTEVSITNVLAHSFDIAFTDNTGGTATSWSVKVNGTAQTITTNPATVTGLNAATAYSIEVAAICSATDMSYYTAAGTIKTACDLVSVPFNEDFSTHSTGAAPDCWDNTTSTSSPLSAVWTVCSIEGDKMVRVNDYSAQDGQAVLTSPIITLPQGGNYAFGFDYDCASTSITAPSVAISTNAGSSWTTLATLPNGTTPYSGGADPQPGNLVRYTYDISSYAGNNVMFKFECTTDYGYGGLFIDNVFVKELLSCSDPNAPVVSNVTATTADVTFNDTCAAHTQWQYVAGVAGFDPTTATPTTITTNSFSLSGLQDDANIVVYVRAYCGAGDSSNWISASFHTLCLPFNVTETTPFYDSFESYGYNDKLASSCYELSAFSSSYYYNVVPYNAPSSTSNEYYSHDGNQMNKALVAQYYKTSFPQGFYIQRPIHLVAGNSYEISAWVLPYYYDANFSILAGVGADLDTVVTTQIAGVQSVYEEGEYRYNEHYTLIKGIITADTTADYTISWNAKYVGSSYYLQVLMDELQVRQFTGCVPSQVSVDSITTNSAVVTIADTDPTHSFQYALNDTTLGITASASNHFALTGLTPSTLYTLYTRTLCDSTSYSEWVEASFTTACGAVTQFPYTQGFEGAFLPSCWSQFSYGTYDNTWSQYNYISHNGSSSASIPDRSAGAKTAMVTGEFNLNSPNGYRIKFWMYRYDDSYSTKVDEALHVGYSSVPVTANNIATAHELGVVNRHIDNAPIETGGTGFYQYQFNIPASVTGSTWFYFDFHNQYGGGIYLDDITIEEIPDCEAPTTAPSVTAVTMTTLSATASMGTKDSIEFAIAPYVANVTPAAAIDTVVSTDGNVLFTGLTGNTRYAVWYRYYCANSAISDWSPMVQATTMATDCFDPLNLSGGIVDDHSATFTWGAAPSVTSYHYELRQGTSASGALVDSGSTVTPQVAYTNLTAMTNYFFRVVGYCSDDTTSWVSLGITTTRTPAPMPFICTFENAGDAAYWETGVGAGSNELVVGSATNNGGSSSIYVSNDGGGTWTYTATAASESYARVLVPMTAGNYLVAYDYSCMGEGSWDYGRIFLYPSANAIGATSSLSSTVPSGNITVSPAAISGDATWKSAQYIVAVPADAMYYFQINWRNDGSVTNGTPLAVDNIRIEPISCMPLNSVATLAINPGSAKFYATRYEAGMELQYGYSIYDNVDSIQWTSIVSANQSDTIALGGLTPATDYYLYVRELCDSTNASSPTRVAFKTLSTAMAIPFVCSFESNQAATNAWTFANSSANEFVIGSYTASAGSQSLYISNDGGATNNYNHSSISYCYATIPIQFSDGTFDITYDWLCQGESASYDYGRVFLAPATFVPQGGVSAGVSTTSAPTGWIAIDGGHILNQQSQWQSVETSVSFTDSTVMNLLVYWWDDSSAGTDPAFTIDNIMITKQTCPALKFDSIRVDTVSTNMFTIHYNNPNVGASTQWILFSDFARLDTVATGIEPAGSNSFTVTGLNASTNYYVTMYAICDTADMSRPLNFSCRTQCATITAYPYDEGFESYTAGYFGVLPGGCWAVSPTEDASDQSEAHYAAVFSAAQSSAAVHSGNNGLAVYHGYYYEGTQILAMPEMDTLNGKTISFYHKAYSTYSYYNQMTFGYINASNQFVTIQSFPLVDDWQEYSTNLTNIPATAHRLAFRFSGEYYYYLDDIHVNRLVQGRTYNDTICFGSAYNAHGISIGAGRLAAGDTTFTKTVRGTAAGQADSITTVNIYVRPEIVNATYDTICQGATTYNKNGWNITNPTSRTYSQQFTAACGCDSTLSLILYVQPNQVTLFDSICQGDSYQFGSMTLTQSGQYKDTVASQWGCDIVRTLNLFVSDTATHLFDQTCLGASYVWEGTTYTQSGTYKKTTVGPLGCPLTKYLHLTMTPSDSTCNVSFCRGGSVQIADTIIMTAGTYTFVRVNPVTECNTTYHVTATETQPTPERVNDEACEGKPYYGYGVSGVVITKDTVITQNTRTAAGNCDSVVIATIKLNKTSYGPTENKSIDAGDSYTWHDNTYTTSGVYYYTTTDINGCDSILKLVLTVGGVTPEAVEDVVMLNISLIPNPVNAGETSFIYGNFTNVKSVEILNSFGQVIDAFVPQTYPIEVQGVNASGVYYVRVVTEDEKVAVEKLIVR